MNFKVQKVIGSPVKLSDNIKYRFFISDDKIPASYLCRDGQIRKSCNIDWQDINVSGWYKTQAEAKSALDKYLNGYSDKFKKFVTNLRDLCNRFLDSAE